MKTRQFLPAIVLAACLMPVVSPANINLDLRPDNQIATVGSTVNLTLYAVSDSAQNESIGAMDVIITWDPAKLQLVGFTNAGNGYAWFQSGFLLPGGLNASYSDGDAIWTAFAQPGMPAYATPAGLKVTTFQFTALATTPATAVAIPRNRGGEQTTVYDGVLPNTDVTGTLDPGANVQIDTDIYPVTSFTLNPGIVISGTVGDMQASDDMYMVFRPGIVLSSTQSPIVLTVETTVASSAATELTFYLESGANQSGITQKVEMFNFTSGMYELVDTQTLSTSDTSISVVKTIGASDYIDSSTKRVRSRISCKQTAPIVSYPWLYRVDYAAWRERT